MKRLVELDPVTMYSKEVDINRLKREAKELAHFLRSLDPELDIANLRAILFPLCMRVADDKLDLPLDPGYFPVNILQMRERGISIPDGFEELYACFMNTAAGARVDFENMVKKEGKIFALMEFE